jgi:hypothetical protein
MTKLVSIEVKFAQVAQALACDAASISRKFTQICGRDTYPIYGTKPPERRFYLIFQVLTSPQLDYRGKAWALLETFPWVLRLIETQRI